MPSGPLVVFTLALGVWTMTMYGTKYVYQNMFARTPTNYQFKGFITCSPNGPPHQGCFCYDTSKTNTGCSGATQPEDKLYLEYYISPNSIPQSVCTTFYALCKINTGEAGIPEGSGQDASCLCEQ